MRLRRIILTSFALGLSLVALNVGSPASVSAESENNDSYVYVAKAGDSYNELARSSIIKFDEANDSVELNTAEVTAAETWLTRDAGSPAIQVGQEVKVSKANTEKFAKQADELSDEAKNLWQGYADKSSISNTDLKDRQLKPRKLNSLLKLQKIPNNLRLKTTKRTQKTPRRNLLKSG